MKFWKWIGIAALISVPIILLLKKNGAEDDRSRSTDERDSDLFDQELN
jgi:hypothetical protein